MKPLFLELGCEEIPARLLTRGVTELAQRLTKGLDALGLEHADLRTFHTPRRLALSLNVTAGQPDKTEELLGPPAKVGFDADGNPTKAAEGFARRHGIDVSEIRVKETERGDYLAATVSTSGQPTEALLPDVITDALSKLQWPKSMRWGANDTPFIRPVHWIVGLFGDTVLGLEFAGITADRQTRGHRFLAPEAFSVQGVEDWLDGLRKAHVEPDPAVRREVIVRESRALTGPLGHDVELDETLLDEVVGLVEWPVPLLASFEQEFLAIPPQVLITAMKSHQRYFPVHDSEGALTNRFVLVANTIVRDPEVVAQGNGRVIRARLADARFFFEQDTRRAEEKGLQDFVEQLKERTFLKGLGTMRDKAERLSRLAGRVARVLDPEDGDAAARATRAGLLAKADLSTEMVGEFPKLQGEMGRDYARIVGESDAISEAIFEHYLPRFADDALPSTALGASVALADRLDSIVGCYALGLEPTGSADPYALRRQALGVLRILSQQPNAPALDTAVEFACTAHDDDVVDDWGQVNSRVLDFFRGRLKNMLAEHYPTDLTEAVLSAGFFVPRDAEGRLAALNTLKETEGWDDLAIAVKRVVRIVQDQPVSELDPTTLSEGAEQDLYAASSDVGAQAQAALTQGAYADALILLASLKPHIDRFFEDVMVLSEDPGERTRRLALLGVVASLFNRVADFSKVST
jgi:glycyl-tRNA synthetase beta chain